MVFRARQADAKEERAQFFGEGKMGFIACASGSAPAEVRELPGMKGGYGIEQDKDHEHAAQASSQ